MWNHNLKQYLHVHLVISVIRVEDILKDFLIISHLSSQMIEISFLGLWAKHLFGASQLSQGVQEKSKSSNIRSPKLGIGAFDLSCSSSTTYVFTLPRESDISHPRWRRRGSKEGRNMEIWETNAAFSPNFGERERERERELICARQARGLLHRDRQRWGRSYTN